MKPESLAQQRLGLRLQLATQRAVIADQLTPKSPVLSATTHRAFPRSLTMQLLIQHPTPALRLLCELTNLVFGKNASSAIRASVQFFKNALAARKLTS
jgi:hypothetical protein